MSYIVQFIALKGPVLAGAGILGVSLAGVCAGFAGIAFTSEAEIISAAIGMIAAAVAVRKRSTE